MQKLEELGMKCLWHINQQVEDKNSQQNFLPKKWPGFLLCLFACQQIVSRVGPRFYSFEIMKYHSLCGVVIIKSFFILLNFFLLSYCLFSYIKKVFSVNLKSKYGKS